MSTAVIMLRMVSEGGLEGWKKTSSSAWCAGHVALSTGNAHFMSDRIRNYSAGWEKWRGILNTSEPTEKVHSALTFVNMPLHFPLSGIEKKKNIMRDKYSFSLLG